MITITDLEAADHALAARLMAASEPWVTLGVTYQSALHRFMSVSYPGVKARDSGGGPLLGFVRYHPAGFVGRWGYVQLVAVAPDQRGKGVGEAMMTHVEERCFRESDHVFLLCSSFNQGARGFYRRRGYVEVGEVPRLIHPVHGEVLMVLRRPAGVGP
jgi:ribosomal protein S18 acetylase RimI-like enzyme